MGSSVLLLLIFMIAIGITGFALLELRIILGYWFRVHGKTAQRELIDIRALDHDALPTVLVQLPLFNEPDVVPSLLEAVAGLHYPQHKMSVQILDDSTDRTTDVIKETLQRLDPEGVQFSHIRRTVRTGYKAGALQEGLEKSDAAFVAVFDADFLPPSDFLLRAFAPGSALSDPSVAFLQGRWSFYNQNQNLLTRVQSILIDRHFYIQKPFQKSGPLTLHFNGSGGIWRRAAIDAAGGWSSDTLCEDLDLTYRCALIGHFGAYDQTLECPSEIPPDLQAFKMQQRRWAKGSAQCARKLMWRVLASSRLQSRIDDVHMLLGYLIHPLVLFFVLLWPWVVLSGVRPELLLPLQLTLVLGNIAAIFGFWSTYRVRGQKLTGLRQACIEIVAALALAVTLMVNNTVAFVAGLISDDGAFDRTPKHGRHLIESGAFLRLRNHWVIWLEAIVGIYGVITGLMLFADGHYVWGQPSLFMGLAIFCLMLVQLRPFHRRPAAIAHTTV